MVNPGLQVIITARKRILGHGNVFTPVCLFTGGVCLQGDLQADPPPLPELEKRAVRILLECFFVFTANTALDDYR